MGLGSQFEFGRWDLDRGQSFCTEPMLRAGRPSVCLSVTLLDCDHIVQQKVEIGV